MPVAGVLVVSWNIKFGERADLAAAELATSVDLAGADVLLLQEMDADGAAHIANVLGMDHVYEALASHRETGRGFGNAILARTPIDAVGCVELPHTARWRGHPRHATVATVELGGRRTSVASVHAEVPLLRRWQRHEQFAGIGAAAVAERPVVIGGDFNTVTARARRDLSAALAASGVRLVDDPDATWGGRVGRRLDHLATRGWNVADSGVDHSTRTSDHFPIWARLTAEESAVGG